MFWKENQEEKDTTDRRGRWLIASSRGTPCPRCRAPPAPPGAASEPRPPPSSQSRLPVLPPWGIMAIRGWITSGATRHLTRHPFGAGSPPPPDPSQRRPSRRAALGLTPPAARLERSWHPVPTRESAEKQQVRASQVTPSQAQASPLVVLGPRHEAAVRVRRVGLEHDQPQHVVVQPRPRRATLSLVNKKCMPTWL